MSGRLPPAERGSTPDAKLPINFGKCSLQQPPPAFEATLNFCLHSDHVIAQILNVVSNAGGGCCNEHLPKFSITRESAHDKIATANNALELACNNITLTGNDTNGRIVLSAKDIMFNGTLNNVYTKTEVDQKIAEAGGGGTTDYNALTNKPIDK